MLTNNKICNLNKKNSCIKVELIHVLIKLSKTFFYANPKLMSFIERVGLKNVGFSCWKLFTINYFKCYEVINYSLIV